jgi:hypothetical protein
MAIRILPAPATTIPLTPTPPTSAMGLTPTAPCRSRCRARRGSGDFSLIKIYETRNKPLRHRNLLLFSPFSTECGCGRVSRGREWLRCPRQREGRGPFWLTTATAGMRSKRPSRRMRKVTVATALRSPNGRDQSRLHAVAVIDVAHQIVFQKLFLIQ